MKEGGGINSAESSSSSRADLLSKYSTLRGAEAEISIPGNSSVDLPCFTSLGASTRLFLERRSSSSGSKARNNSASGFLFFAAYLLSSSYSN